MTQTEITTSYSDTDSTTKTECGNKVIHISKKIDISKVTSVELDLSKYKKTEGRKRVVAHVSTKS